MKKFYFLIVLCCCSLASNSQQLAKNKCDLNQYNSIGTPLTPEQLMHMCNMPYCGKDRNSPHSKKTSGSSAASDWYSLIIQNFVSGRTKLFAYDIFPDSNLYEHSGTDTGYTMLHGMGMSFDFTDSGYYSYSVNGGALVSAVSWPIFLTAWVSWPVVVDSFYTPIQYIRNDATTVDSLIIEFTIAYGPTIHDTGTYNIQLPASGMFSNMTFDSAPRFGDVHYNSGCGMRPAYSGEPYINDCYFDSVFAPKWRYAFPLNATTASDTDSNGLLLLGEMPVSLTRNSVSIPRLPTAGLYSLPLDTILVNGSLLGLNPHVVSFVSFKSGHSGGTYPHGTSSNSGNYIKLFAGSPVGDTTWFMQSAHNAAYTYQGSYQASLYAINSERYNDTFFSMPTGAHDILVPAWELSPRFSVADQSFHVSSEIGWEGITDINDLRSLVTVYPDPASDILNVMVSPSRNDELTVILTNAAGQVVAKQVGKNPTGKYVFNTSALPNGVYIYSVICGGQKQSGRTLIMHQ